MNYVEHFCDLRIDADLYLGNNVLMAKLRVLDSLGMQSGLNNISLKYGIHEQCYNMRFVDLFLSLQTNSSQISYQIVCLHLTGSDAPSQTYIKVYCYVLYITE